MFFEANEGHESVAQMSNLSSFTRSYLWGIHIGLPKIDLDFWKAVGGPKIVTYSLCVMSDTAKSVQCKDAPT